MKTDLLKIDAFDIIFFVIVPGTLGGVVNALFVHRGLWLPRLAKVDSNGGRWFFDPGCLANILIGAVASFLAFCFAPETSVLAKLGLCVLAAVGGSNFIASLSERHKSDFFRSQLESLLKAETKQKKQPRRDATLPDGNQPQQRHDDARQPEKGSP